MQCEKSSYELQVLWDLEYSPQNVKALEICLGNTFEQTGKKMSNRIKWLLFMAFYGKMQGLKTGKSLSQAPQSKHNGIHFLFLKPGCKSLETY